MRRGGELPCSEEEASPFPLPSTKARRRKVSKGIMCRVSVPTPPLPVPTPQGHSTHPLFDPSTQKDVIRQRGPSLQCKQGRSLFLLGWPGPRKGAKGPRQGPVTTTMWPVLWRECWGIVIGILQRCRFIDPCYFSFCNLFHPPKCKKGEGEGRGEKPEAEWSVCPTQSCPLQV